MAFSLLHRALVLCLTLLTIQISIQQESKDVLEGEISQKVKPEPATEIEYFRLRLAIESPSAVNPSLGPVVPITISLNFVDETSEAQNNDVLRISYSSSNQMDYAGNSNSGEFKRFLLQRANLQVCVFTSIDPYAHCTPDVVRDSTINIGSLSQPSLYVEHVVWAWVRVFDSEVEFLVDPSTLPERKDVLAFSRTNFIVARSERQMENLKDDVIHATNINNVHFTTDHRTEYFNRVYENEVWAFPDPLEKRIPGGGVRSGSGSTVSKTENVR